MKGFDLVVLICTSLLIAKGMWKGFIKEIAGIIAVLLAVVLSFSFHDKAVVLLSNRLHFTYLSSATYVVLFVGVYLLVKLIGRFIDNVLKSIMLGGVNRILGGLFGGLKSALWFTIITYAYTIAKTNVGFDHPTWIQDSKCFPVLVDFAEILSNYLA
jgi:membrane protein required for colicin V production